MIWLLLNKPQFSLISVFVVEVKIIYIFTYLRLAHFAEGSLQISFHLSELLFFPRPGKIYSKIYYNTAQK